uniref:Exocyst subunit Exo70 family protein n=1 Tax=Leersia perrieri TaxID=77586 RepID=A0A0D9XX73_9ORYZ
MPLRRRDMDSSRSQAPHKSSSFSPATTARDADDAAAGNGKPIDRHLSLGAARQHADHHPPIPTAVAIKEECEDEAAAERDHAAAAGGGDGEIGEPDLAAISAEIDAFIAGGGEPVSEATLERFASAVENEIAESESASDKWAPGPNGEPRPLLAAISRLASLAAALAGKSHRVTAVLHRAMAFLEDEFHALLESNASPSPPEHEPDRCVLPAAAAAAASDAEPHAPPYPTETVDRLRSMADAMVSAGYVTECTQMFLVARRNAFDASLRAVGYDKPSSTDDVARMTWDALESEIATWTRAFRHATSVGLAAERDLAARVFSGRHVGRGVFADLARCVMLHMLSFTEAVSVTKRAAEKLFKVLDMYEVIRDAVPIIDAFIAADADADATTTALADLRDELAAVRSRIGEFSAAFFLELEISIRADAGKQPVPGGAVHPLTRYVMNYLKYACEYNSTLEQIFRHHNHNNNSKSSHDGGSENVNPFALQLMEVMELLQTNLEGKSRLYRDASLSNIFLMNNGRYMLQKIRGSPETNAMLGGEAWARKQSTNLRQYHKNYQRETWSRVLNLLKDDGVITVKGSVQKPVLKERFKQFNAAMDEIQRTQGSWVVSDEQLQSELRVSIAAVVVPAYRSFLGRFAQTFSAGRQTEKYVKLSADDVEAIIDELFDGNATSMGRRRT